jgi:hypothetical protein
MEVGAWGVVVVRFDCVKPQAVNCRGGDSRRKGAPTPGYLPAFFAREAAVICGSIGWVAGGAGIRQDRPRTALDGLALGRVGEMVWW